MYTVIDTSQHYVAFEKPFFVYWEKEIGVQCCRFIDPEGNVFEIQLNEALLAKRKFPAGFLLAKMYNLRLLYFINVRYVGGNLFHSRVFDWD